MRQKLVSQFSSQENAWDNFHYREVFPRIHKIANTSRPIPAIPKH